MSLKFTSLVLLVFALCACHPKEDKAVKPVSNAPIEHYRLDGVVVSLDPQGQIAKINGQKINGWMEAMTMEYPVKDPVEFASLHVGDRITATVSVQDLNYWISGIQPFR